MRFIAVISACLLSSVAVAKPSRYPPVTLFSGDRYVLVSQSNTTAADVIRSVRCPPPACQRGSASKAKYLYRTKPRQKAAPVPRSRPGTVAPLTLAGGAVREVNSAIASIAGGYMGGNPTGWRSRWCGNFMRLVVRKAGLPDHPTGNLARNWRSYGRPAGSHAGSIGVMRSHVGIVIGRCPDGRILLRSGNHGRRVGDGCYAASRFIAFRAA